VGQHALHAHRDGRRAPVQTLEELDVGGGDDLRIAPVADDADRPVHEVELVEHLDDEAPCNRVSATRTEVVFRGLQEIGREGRDLARAGESDGCSRSGHRASAPCMASRILARITSTPSKSPCRIPDSSWLTPPIDRTGTAPFSARRTSSTIWPA